MPNNKNNILIKSYTNTINRRIVWRTGLLCFFVLGQFMPFALFGQDKKEKKELADEYFKRANFSKALEIYEDLQGDATIDAAIFQNYMVSLKKEKPAKLETVLKKYLKKYPQDFEYLAYQFKYFKEEKREKDLEKYAEGKLLPWMLKTSDRAKTGFAFFSDNGAPVLRATLLEKAIREFGLASLWKEAMYASLAEKKYAAVTQLIIQLGEQKQVSEEELQTYLQEHVLSKDLSRQLQMDLLKQIQAKPGDSFYPSFLAWVYVQQKDFDGALAQYKALDILLNTQGTKVFRLGEFAVTNQQPRLAIKCFEFVVQQFPNTQNRYLAQQKLIQLKEEVVKNTYPVNKSEVRSLIEEYGNLATNQYLNAFDLTLKIAELYGKYLNRPDSAIQIIEESIKNRRWPQQYHSRAKVMLGDMYILKDEPWEASLLYGQVEKDEAESPIGYEAKLKNAKVFYFKGEFELCQEQLDVLKMSTTRDISNDAIELGLLLQDILAEDTTGYFLSKFADIDLLTFQGNYPGSISQIEALTSTVSNPIVLEKLKYRLFKNYEATRQFDLALEQLDQIYKTKASDLYLDDALYYSGNIVAEQKKDSEKAIAFYLQLIKEIPGSVYVAEARKKLRALRGDGVN